MTDEELAAIEAKQAARKKLARTPGPWSSQPAYSVADGKLISNGNTAIIGGDPHPILATAWTGARKPTTAGDVRLMEDGPEMLAEIDALLDEVRRRRAEQGKGKG